jgi:hypothetical protein
MGNGKIVNPELIEKRRLMEKLKVRVSKRAFDYINQVRLKQQNGLDSCPKIIDFLIKERIKLLKENRELKKMLELKSPEVIQ